MISLVKLHEMERSRERFEKKRKEGSGGSRCENVDHGDFETQILFLFYFYRCCSHLFPDLAISVYQITLTLVRFKLSFP